MFSRENCTRFLHWSLSGQVGIWERVGDVGIPRVVGIPEDRYTWQ